MWVYVDPALTNAIVGGWDNANGWMQWSLTPGVDTYVQAGTLNVLTQTAASALPSPVGMSHAFFDYAVFTTALGWFMGIFVTAFGVGVIYRLLTDRY